MLCFYLFSFFLLERFWENTVANTTKAPAVNNIDSAALVISDADSSKINIKYLFVTLESVHLFQSILRHVLMLKEEEIVRSTINKTVWIWTF